MSYYFDNNSKEREKMRLKSFLQFLSEANHGIYNKDPRLKILSQITYDDINSKLSKVHNKFIDIKSDISNVKISPRTINIHWAITKNKEEDEPEFRDSLIENAGAVYNPKTNTAIISIKLLKVIGPNQDFLKEVKEFMKDDVNMLLYHEFKHILDVIDGKLTSNNRGNVAATKDNVTNGKYQSQDKEIHNYLLSIIGEFEGISKREPGISLSSAIKRSKLYHKILDPMETSKQNMIKGKLVDFWVETYGKKNLH